MSRTTRLFVFLLSVSVPLFLPAADQENLSQEDREYYDLHLRFAARVVLNDGTRIELTDFHVGSGRHRHWVLTAGRSSLYIPLKTIKSIERIGAFADRANLFLTNETQMGIVWARIGTQKLCGTLPDGKAWEEPLSSVREVVIRQIEQEDQDDAGLDEGGAA